MGAEQAIEHGRERGKLQQIDLGHGRRAGALSSEVYTWKMVVKGQLMLKMLRMRDTTLPADRELPPIWKKSASTLIGFCCSTCITQNASELSAERVAPRV